jgi:hypothetical protein
MVVQCVLFPPAEQEKKLATLSIVLGSLYVGAAAMFLFGVVAAGSVCHLFTTYCPLLSMFSHHYTETFSPHPYIRHSVCRGERYHNCIWFSANDSPLYAQGKVV